jgi:hypothetical protein
MYRPWRLCAVLTVLLLGCAGRPVGYSDFDPGTDFSGFRTFAWLPGKVLVTATPNPVNPGLEGILKEETLAYLNGRGYRFADDPRQADFVIGFAVGGAPTVHTATFRQSYRDFPIIGRSPPVEVAAQEGIEANLVIDLYERKSGRKKWMGWSVTEVTRSDQLNLRPGVRQLVGTILKHFPPEIPGAQGG